MRDAFVIYRNFFECIEELNIKDQLKTYKALANFALNDIEADDLTGTAKIIYDMAKPAIIASAKRYDAGKKGGRPTNDNTPIKKIEGITLVNLSEKQYDTLIDKYGEKITQKAIELFDDYLNKGTKTAREYIGKNHYAHFKVDSWAVRKAETIIKEEQAKNRPNWGVPDDVQWERF